jgi:hypothetical protein
MADPIISSASSFIELYTDGDARDSNMFQVAVTSTGVQMADQKGSRAFKLYSDDIQFAKKGGLQMYKPRDRFDAAEVATGVAQAAAVAAAASAAAETARATQEESKISADVTAANVARGILQSTLVAADSAEAATRAAAITAVQAAASQEVADRIAGVNAAGVVAAAASAAIQLQITNLLDGSAANLQTLAQVAAYANSLDGENDALLAALTADVVAMRAELDVLLGL